MKKRFQFRTLVRQIAERFATILFGLICLVLIIHYWPSDTEEQTERTQGGLVSKVIVVMDGEKIILLQKKSSVSVSRIVKRIVGQSLTG
ncbi:hypothetical protein [Undibacterium sp. Ji22W]|uniref:hypothetical protein n=1 Tax=Undibacterium sp. Ji22W TaxID=3413038 RepID=UPI003BF16090